MNRYNFPFDYHPEVDFVKTIEYLSLYNQKLIAKLKDIYKPICVDSPIASNILNSYNAFYFGERQINFDNKFVKEAYQINTNLDNYFHLLLTELIPDVEALISNVNIIKRDALLTNLDPFNSNLIHIELNTLLENHNVNIFKNWFDQLWTMILNINAEKELSKIYLPKQFVKDTSIEFATIQQIAAAYPLLSIDKAFDYYCSKYKLLVVLNPYSKLLTGEYFKKGLPTANNFNCSSILYYYSAVHNKPIPLIKISSRPSGLLAKDQLLQLDPFAFDNNLINDNLFNPNLPQTIGIDFYFSNLMLINLNKIHLAEVINSIWPNEFIDFVNNEKIKIM